MNSLTRPITKAIHDRPQVAASARDAIDVLYVCLVHTSVSSSIPLCIGDEGHTMDPPGEADIQKRKQCDNDSEDYCKYSLDCWRPKI